MDLHAMLKSCYFGDKELLNSEGQPIFGATYRAMRFGPVPLEIYEMAKGEALWLAETGVERFPWRLDGFRLQLAANSEPDLSVFSPADFAALEIGFERSRTMNFTERTAATHGADWQAAALGTMRYEDMLNDTPEKPATIAYLEQAAPIMRL
ncbi:type II toxin-antitoxin system antitoxin SocA domain-containing protein [Muricoccus nepalensis]|uniref:type II toxin-antitoxin system antitoxin SocA domain-containing protein n=1 Tax=Muricoccus nepalensis TaxID=1854500 RepID=UPI001386D400|nr:type II toxin-antitoxin system antitoxin SocA domain-containing protein [Roseomonas nepalensis]